jgi:hypothetical protein
VSDGRGWTRSRGLEPLSRATQRLVGCARDPNGDDTVGALIWATTRQRSALGWQPCFRGGELHGEFPTTVADFPSPTSPLKIGRTARVGNNVGNSEAHDPLMASRAAPPLRRSDHRRGRSAPPERGYPEAETVADGDLAASTGGTGDGHRSPAGPTNQFIANPCWWPDLARDGTAGGAARVRKSGLRMLTASIPVRILASASVRARRRENRQSARSPLMGVAHARDTPGRSTSGRCSLGCRASDRPGCGGRSSGVIPTVVRWPR